MRCHPQVDGLGWTPRSWWRSWKGLKNRSLRVQNGFLTLVFAFLVIFFHFWPCFSRPLWDSVIFFGGFLKQIQVHLLTKKVFIVGCFFCFFQGFWSTFSGGVDGPLGELIAKNQQSTARLERKQTGGADCRTSLLPNWRKRFLPVKNSSTYPPRACFDGKLGRWLKPQKHPKTKNTGHIMTHKPDFREWKPMNTMFRMLNVFNCFLGL